MMDVLDFSFFQNALWASLFISVSCGILGVFVIVNRLVFLSGAIAHGAYGGVGIAFFLGLSPLFGAGIFAVFLALIIGFIALKYKSNCDAIIGAIWAFGMAVGIIFTDLTPGYNVDLLSYLFGGILGVSQADLWAMKAVGFLSVIFVVIFFHQLKALSFDYEFSALRGVRVNFLYFCLLVLIALVIVVSVRAVGLILVIALLSIPPFIAQIFSRNLASMIILSILISIFLCVFGLILSYKFNLSSGPCIILLSSVAFFASILWKKITDFVMKIHIKP